MNKLPPSVEHFRLSIKVLVEMLEAPDGLKHQIFLVLCFSMKRLEHFGIIIALFVQHVLEIPQLRLIVKVLLSYRPFFVKLYGERLLLGLIAPHLEDISHSLHNGLPDN